MSRKTVSAPIPAESPDELQTLGDGLVAQHEALGDVSPLDKDKMTTLKNRLSGAKSADGDFKSREAQAQSFRQVRDTHLGISEGQNVTTPGTALNLINYARKQLLVTYEGNEEKLKEFKFNVVVGTAKTPARKNTNGNGNSH